MTILKTNWVTKLVTLVEDNPLAKSFEDVEQILIFIVGKDNFTIKCVSNDFPKLQMGDTDTIVELIVPFSKTYEVSIDGELFSILVENWGSNKSPKFIVNLLFNETSQTYVETLL